MLSSSGLAHRLEGKLDPTTTASAPVLSLPSCPSAALTHSPGVRKLPPPPALGPVGSPAASPEHQAPLDVCLHLLGHVLHVGLQREGQPQ